MWFGGSARGASWVCRGRTRARTVCTVVAEDGYESPGILVEECQGGLVQGGGCLLSILRHDTDIVCVPVLPLTRLLQGRAGRWVAAGGAEREVAYVWEGQALGGVQQSDDESYIASGSDLPVHEHCRVKPGGDGHIVRRVGESSRSASIP